MTPSIRGALVAAAACSSLLAAPARADDACGQDIKSYCDGVKPGQGRMDSCLRSHWGELQPSCRRYLDLTFSKAEAFVYQCETEIFDLCRGVPAGKGDTIACLRAHRSGLSPECAAAVDKAKPPD